MVTDGARVVHAGILPVAGVIPDRGALVLGAGILPVAGGIPDRGALVVKAGRAPVAGVIPDIARVESACLGPNTGVIPDIARVAIASVVPHTGVLSDLRQYCHWEQKSQEHHQPTNTRHPPGSLRAHLSILLSPFLGSPLLDVVAYEARLHGRLRVVQYQAFSSSGLFCLDRSCGKRADWSK